MPGPPLPTYQPFGEPAPRKGTSTLVKVLVLVGLLFGLTCLVCIGTCAYYAATSPPAEALVGAKVPKKFVEQMKELGVLRDDEVLECFFSDALLSIENGVYVLTDKRLVLYSNTWAESEISIALEDIADVKANFSKSWIDDTVIFVDTKDGRTLSFPVATFEAGDKMYFNRLKALVDAATD